MTLDLNQLLFWTVVAARVLVPLTIPRYPLPGLLAALVLDAVDQTLFQALTGVTFEGYQAYDKALDIYYLAIAHIATLRNWTNFGAQRIGHALFYYRLIGVVLFELLQSRWILLIFPNVFEYFFIAYEAFRGRWDPRRLSLKTLLVVTAVIWIFIKLPQEYWLHVAQLDFTDVVKGDLLGYAPTTSWMEVLTANVGLAIAIAAVLGLFLFLTGRKLAQRLPPSDWTTSGPAAIRIADVNLPLLEPEELARVEQKLSTRLLDWELLEKSVLATLLAIIFAQILPGMRASTLELVLAVMTVIVLNTWLTERLVQRGISWGHALQQGLTMLAINLPVFFLISFLRYGYVTWTALANIMIFVLLLSLIVTLFDRYRPIYLIRFNRLTP